MIQSSALIIKKESVSVMKKQYLSVLFDQDKARKNDQQYLDKNQ